MWTNRAEYEGARDAGRGEGVPPKWVATVQFQGRSREGVPRFPVIVGFRHRDDR